MKALLLSVRPEHALNILNGSKTLELRKSVPKGFKGWVYAYVTEGKPYMCYFTNPLQLECLNGTVPFRFWFDEYIAYEYYADDNIYFAKRPQDLGYNADEVLKHLCLTREQFKWYGNRKDLYAWHIKNLDIFPKPMQLGEFYKTKGKYLQDYERAVLDYKNRLIESESTLKNISITKAPQSYMYIYVKEGLK